MSPKDRPSTGRDKTRMNAVHQSPAYRDLLSGTDVLTNPDLLNLHEHCGRNDMLLHAVLCAFAKHNLDCEEIGWEQLGDILCDAICNEIGDDAFCRWVDRIRENQTCREP